jgi:ergothioneine biosynthesis protein EgtB
MAVASRPSRSGQTDSLLAQRYLVVRAHTERLCQPLREPDYEVSTLPETSPAKWHLAHTTWFIETFVLMPYDPAYVLPNTDYGHVFSGYYGRSVERQWRAIRGLESRPAVEEAYGYRRHVDEAMLRFFEHIGDDRDHPAMFAIELALNHEQQHQELMLADIKHAFFVNPARKYHVPGPERHVSAPPFGWQQVSEGVHHIGHGTQSIAFDNERPRHRVFVEPFRIATRLVTNGEYREFIRCGGYRRQELWTANGWALVGQQQREAPLYWERADDGWTEFTLAGQRQLDDDAPVCHVSYYEADAYARWAGARLPSEAEWEVAATKFPDIQQLFGRRWQWTQSAYVAYPGAVRGSGAVGEYAMNWMSDNWVLRGSSSATPPGHERVTYRHYLGSDARWQFTGIRLASS